MTCLKTNASINSYFQSSVPSTIQYTSEFFKINFIKSPMVLQIWWQFKLNFQLWTRTVSNLSQTLVTQTKHNNKLSSC